MDVDFRFHQLEGGVLCVFEGSFGDVQWCFSDLGTDFWMVFVVVL